MNGIASTDAISEKSAGIPIHRGAFRDARQHSLPFCTDCKDDADGVSSQAMQIAERSQRSAEVHLPAFNQRLFLQRGTLRSHV